MYGLGAGIARYLGASIDWSVFLLGQIWGTMLQLSTHYLNEYYNSPADGDNPNRTLFTGGSDTLGTGKLPRVTALIAAITTLTITASITVLLNQFADLNPVTYLVMILIFLGAFFYSTPPVRLEASGYGELTTSILVANLAPAFAFLLQMGELHRILAMTTFPLTALHLAMLLAFELPDYGNDFKYGKTTMMVRLGWQTGMAMHNLMVLLGYFLLGLAIFFSLPLAIALPAFLTLPLGLLQIWYMYRISAGAPPNWRAVTLGAVALFALTAYLLAFGFWTR